mgnify:CR=1 FL=1
MDDGSKDNTVRVAFDYVRRYSLDLVRVIKQGRNYGKGAAVRKVSNCTLTCAQAYKILLVKLRICTLCQSNVLFWLGRNREKDAIY